jgi:hypothetical protein
MTGRTQSSGARRSTGHVELQPARRFVDQFLETYVSWRERCLDVEARYIAWRDAERSHRGAAFVAYHAALDGEQSAARTHERSIARLRAECAIRVGAAGPSAGTGPGGYGPRR